jgi:hypothetical protein
LILLIAKFSSICIWFYLLRKFSNIWAFDSIASVYISNIVSALQISARSSSTVLVAYSAALLNSNSASSTLNVNSFLYLAAMEAIANMQYHIREVSKSQPPNNDDRYRMDKNSFIIIAVNSCVNILFALCGIYTIKNIYVLLAMRKHYDKCIFYVYFSFCLIKKNGWNSREFVVVLERNYRASAFDCIVKFSSTGC